MRIKEKITDYKNFWLIWINSAGGDRGISLFEIQTTWDVKTNYLYHNEVGLKSPLFRCMIRENYITKEGKRLRAEYAWIPAYVRERYFAKETAENWVPDFLLRTRWPAVQKFMEKYHAVLFDKKNLKILYKNDKEVLGKYGPHIFADVFLYVLFSNLRLFCRKYEADVVLRMIATMISLSAERDLLNYMRMADSKLRNVVDFPVLVKDENELSRILCALKW
jgi:hypothetical protein